MDKRAAVTNEPIGVQDPRRFCEILRKNLIPIAVWHRDGRIRDANDAYFKMVGYSRDELRQGEVRCDRITAPEHLHRDEYAINELVSGRKVCAVFEKDYVCRNRGRVPVLLGGVLVPGRCDQGIAFVLDLAKPISARNAVQAQRDVIQQLCASVVGEERAPDILQLAAQAEGTLRDSGTPEAGIVLAHELSQPLASILANAQAARKLLRQHPRNVELLKAIVSDIISEDRRAGRLVNQVRLRFQGRKCALRAVPVNEVLAGAARAMGHEFAKRSISVNISLGPESPMVRGDRLQLHQLFTNLFFNACEALEQMPRSSRHILIYSAVAPDGMLSVDVQDTGPGIPPEQLEAVFRPFVSTKPQGSGVGLYICRSIARAHGGSLTAANGSGGGAVLQLLLPVIGEK